MITKIIFILTFFFFLSGGVSIFYARLNSLHLYFEAEGKIIGDFVKVNSFEAGIVSKINVKNGESVKSGQILVEILPYSSSPLSFIEEEDVKLIISPTDGEVANLYVSSGDTIDRYAKLMEILVPESFKIEATFNTNTGLSDIVKLGRELVWYSTFRKEKFLAEIDYIYPYIENGNFVFTLKLIEAPTDIFVNEKVRVIIR